MRTTLWCWIVALCCCSIHTAFAVQSFRTAPSDRVVIKGDVVVIDCVIDNLKGRVQWTKNGFALGFDRRIPGFARYQVIGSEALGEYNLMLSAAELSDDAEYQCQVGPAEGGEPPLLGTALVSVHVPPGAPAIAGYTNGSEVRVPHEQESLSLTCTANNGKPAAEIKWFKNNVEITTGIVASSETLDSKLENSKSVLTIAPKDDDNNAFYRCEAKNSALLKPLFTTVVLSVLHPPGEPEISGYRNGQVVKTNDTVKMVCRSKGGNPEAKVYWYKDDEEIDFSYVIKDNEASNEIVFTVQPNDNNAKYRCEASNIVTKKPLVKEVILTVQFAPAKVTITGHQNAKAGETIKMKCESDISNPAAEISWFTRGRQLEGGTQVVKASDKGGFVTSSEISVTLTDQENTAVYQCAGTNPALGPTAEAYVTLQVMYPPGQPTILGYTSGKLVTAGNIQSMKCTSVGGNPLATLTWWKGDEQLVGTTTITGNIVSTQLERILKADDNEAEYRCNATNSATDTPLIASVTLNVNFPPEGLTITTSPAKIKVGEKLTITCRSSTSNPASVLSWWKDNEEIKGIDGGMVDAEHGGKSTIAQLELVPTAADNEEIYACRATNPLIEHAVSDAVTLNVPYPPVFPPDVPSTVDVEVMGFAMINVTVLANPPAVTYTWFRNGEALKLGELSERKKREVEMLHFLARGALLNVTNVTRADAGAYVVKAENSEGATEFTVNLNVQYGAEITELESLVVDAGTNATITCKVAANPTPADFISWERTGYDLGAKTVIASAGGVSTLTVIDTEKTDSGQFVCKANNGIGEAVEKTVDFVVKYAPEIDKSKVYSKAAADKGATAKLTCKAEGAPDVSFEWLKNGEAVNTSAGTKFTLSYEKTGLVQHLSHLSVHNTTKLDYGIYQCVAKNELGQDTNDVTLDGTSIPDPPTDLKFINATHNSVTISWTPGFDGGLEQSFRVMYFEPNQEEPKIRHENVQPSFATVYTIKDLKLATEYEMTVKSINRLGESTYQKAAIRTRTSAAAPITGAVQGDDVPLIIILTVSIIGMVLLGLNILLILFFIRRRRRRLEKESSETTSQANTLEMYQAPTITDDSKSYTTYGNRSIDDYDDFYKPYGDDEDIKRFLPPPYPNPYADTYMPAKPNYYGPPPSMSDYGVPPTGPIDHPPPPRRGTSDMYLDNDRSWGFDGPYGGAEDDLYADQLRSTLQQGIKNPGGKVPPTPTRADPGPPLPSRNYGPEDVQPTGRYGNVPSHGGRSPGPGGPRDNDVRGALV